MIDPQVQAVLTAMEQNGIPAVHTLDPNTARQAYLSRKDLVQPDARAVGVVKDMSIETAEYTIPVRYYHPSTSPGQLVLPALVYFHGGGFVIGNIESHDRLCRELCVQANCVVISVDYRLAPEHRYPAAGLDCLAATRWVHSNAAHLGIDPTRIAVGGDSAGGQLAAVTTLALRDDPQLKLAFQLLIYPVTDVLMSSDSIERNGQGYILGKLDLAYFYQHYFENEADKADPMASPLRAPDLSGLPPALVLTAGYDPLHDEGYAYADALSKAGVPTQYICFTRQVHGFILMGKLIDEANFAVSTCALALRRALYQE
jgi:acetyl esterase